MILMKASVEVISDISDPMAHLRQIELAGRTCYKSEDKIHSDITTQEFVRKLIKNGHNAMLEHGPNISLRFICDRGISHAIVRHRLFSFAQESTIYCRYDGGVAFIVPYWWQHVEDGKECSERDRAGYADWKNVMQYAEEAYLALRNSDFAPKHARTVLPTSVKTELVVTGNIRQWRHFFKERVVKHEHPQMHEVGYKAFCLLHDAFPVIFDDLSSPWAAIAYDRGFTR